MLFHEGDTEDRLYVVVSGKIKLGRSGSAGRENLLAVLGSGPDVRRAVGVRSRAAIDHRDRRHRVRDPDPGARRADGLADRPTRGGSRPARPSSPPGCGGPTTCVADLVFSDVPGRVAKQLLELAQRFGDRRDDGMHVHHDLTQEELAQLVGASRETVNKALADFAARGWIRLEPRSVTILDVERVERRAR